jgi:predicted XRE-type DNA-binding protein
MKDITREELLRSKEYWTSDIQLKLFAEIERFMEENNMNRTQLADYLGCTKGYVSQLLSGDYDNKLSKFVELSLSIGKLPILEFEDVDSYILSESITFHGFGETISSWSSSGQTGKQKALNKELITAA